MNLIEKRKKRKLPAVNLDGPPITTMERLAILVHMKADNVERFEVFRTYSKCDICRQLGKDFTVGASSYTDGVWRWDSLDPHLIEEHGYSPGADFVGGVMIKYLSGEQHPAPYARTENEK